MKLSTPGTIIPEALKTVSLKVNTLDFTWPEIRDSMAATHAHRCRTRSWVTNESQNHFKENSALSANLPLIIAPVLQPPEETTSSRSQNKVDYMYNLSLRALCAFACVKAVSEAIFVGRRNPHTPPYIFLITVRR